jgi:acylphosphatase
MASLRERLHAVVRGRVQGVSFRYYTQERAAGLGLRGWVRNRPDGSVEVLAEGARPDLQHLLDFLGRGPRAAVVAGVEAEWTPAQGGLEGFEIRW